MRTIGLLYSGFYFLKIVRIIGFVRNWMFFNGRIRVTGGRAKLFFLEFDYLFFPGQFFPNVSLMFGVELFFLVDGFSGLIRLRFKELVIFDDFGFGLVLFLAIL